MPPTGTKGVLRVGHRMPKATKSKDKVSPAPPLPLAPARSSLPLTTRLAIEIPKPKDWQACQRNCVLLFRAELNDPHAQEYGRPGQKQGGIDILARRDGRDDHFVGVQCRLIARPLRKAEILSDAREALKLKAGLKELVFATTAPDDRGASDAAIEVSRELKAEGRNVLVVVYGWGQLQTLIAPHEVAYNAFHPSTVASSLSQPPGPAPAGTDFPGLVAARLLEQMRSAGIAVAPREEGAAASSDEDPILHARIDTFRDLFKDLSKPLVAEKRLLGLLDRDDLSSKPWARFRIETNLGAIALHLGRETEAAARFEAAHALRPDDPSALAKLALARTIQGRFDEAMMAARAALDGEPRADHAVPTFYRQRPDRIGRAIRSRSSLKTSSERRKRTLDSLSICGAAMCRAGPSAALRWPTVTRTRRSSSASAPSPCCRWRSTLRRSSLAAAAP